MKNKVVQVILGAGRPFRGTENSSLKKVSSHARVLDWTLQAAKFLNPEVHFVAGYQVDEIISRYPSLHYTINPKWRTTGPIISLLEARLANDSEYHPVDARKCIRGSSPSSAMSSVFMLIMIW